jgi:SHS2 domain-containing protein
VPACVRIVEHTADVGIEADGATLEQCFARAAAGMFACYLRGGAEQGLSLDVEVRADGPGELLVAWLEELHYRAEVGRLAPQAFEVIEVGRSSLRGRMWVMPLRPNDEPAGAAVKAVTRHELTVERADGRWRARVLFDV